MTFRRIVISDIHGCSKTFTAMIEEKIQLNKDDHLYLLGDYIDRGPDSAGVLDYIMKLIDDGYLIYPLRGNHEENILKAYKEYDTETFAFFVKKVNKSYDLLDEDFSIKKKYYDFMNSLTYYYELEDFIIVHAGLNFKSPDVFADYVSMLELRATYPDKSIIGNKKIIHGHQVYHIDEIIRAVEQKMQVLPLDNGCVYTKPHKIYDYTRTGNLCGLNLDTFELILQRNIETKN